MQEPPYRQGAQLVPEGICYTAWAPRRQAVVVEVLQEDGSAARTVSLECDDDGFFTGVDTQGRPGDVFKMRLDGGEAFPPPAAQFLPHGVHGPGRVTGGKPYPWHDESWERPLLRDLIIYELHLGTFTPEGTFRAALGKLRHLRELGINAIEIMPLGDFPGERNWGYDGVQIYAPARCYGEPDDLRALVDAAHGEGIAVILDVVYNHLGPDGNYLPAFSPYYFSSEDKTPWGDAVNFGHWHSQPVRDFYRGNVEYWMDEFHFDGFRLDATHAIIDPSPRHILQELAEAVHRRGGYIIAEDERNEAKIVRPAEEGGYGFDAVWADDFHHTVEVATIDASVYRHDFTGELNELVTALQEGWVYRGQATRKRGKARGTSAEGVPPERFIYCISNHDQAGNRALGERINHLVSPATYRAASALLLLAPYTPLLFMGQEWGASTPFQYFTDHHETLGALVEKGRREEFSEAFAHSAALAAHFPSPQAKETFQNSKLNWAEACQEPHAQILELYRELIKLRRENAEFRPQNRAEVQFSARPETILEMRVGEWLLLGDLKGGHRGALPDAGPAWRVVLSTNETRFGGAGTASFRGFQFDFAEPEVLVLRRDASAR